MSLLGCPSVRSSVLCLDELEDAFRAWAHDLAKPDVVDPGPRRRSLRAASYSLRGLPRFDTGFQPVTCTLGSGTNDSRGDCDVR